MAPRLPLTALSRASSPFALPKPLARLAHSLLLAFRRLDRVVIPKRIRAHVPGLVDLVDDVRLVGVDVTREGRVALVARDHADLEIGEADLARALDEARNALVAQIMEADIDAAALAYARPRIGEAVHVAAEDVFAGARQLRDDLAGLGGQGEGVLTAVLGLGHVNRLAVLGDVRPLRPRQRAAARGRQQRHANKRRDLELRVPREFVMVRRLDQVAHILVRDALGNLVLLHLHARPLDGVVERAQIHLAHGVLEDEVQDRQLLIHGLRRDVLGRTGREQGVVLARLVLAGRREALEAELLDVVAADVRDLHFHEPRGIALHRFKLLPLRATLVGGEDAVVFGDLIEGVFLGNAGQHKLILLVLAVEGGKPIAGRFLGRKELQVLLALNGDAAAPVRGGQLGDVAEAVTHGRPPVGRENRGDKGTVSGGRNTPVRERSGIAMHDHSAALFLPLFTSISGQKSATEIG